MTLLDPDSEEFALRQEKVAIGDAKRNEEAKRYRPVWGSPNSGREALEDLDFHRAYELLR